MNAITIEHSKKHFTFIIQNVVSFVFILCLGFIKDDRFSFDWMLIPYAWLGILINLGVFSIGQMICKVYLFKNEYNWVKSSLIGMIGVLITLGIIFMLGLLGNFLS